MGTSQRRWIPDSISVSAWTLALVVFFWSVLSGQRVLFYFDITELNYPYRAYFGNELQAGHFPLWCPHLYCGFPLFAESQTGYLYPLKYLLYPWMPPWLAFGYDTVLSVWLAGLAMYAYLRRRFGAAASLAGAVPFGYGGFMAAHLIHTSYVNSMMWIPLAVFAMERCWETARARHLAYAALALTMQILAGNMQIAILTYLLLAVLAAYWAVVALAERAPRRALWVLGSSAAALLLATAMGAVQILPAKQLLDRSPRRNGVPYDELTNQSSWHPELLPTLLMPGAYGSRSHNTDWLDGFYWYHETYTYLGITTLFLALLGGAQWRERWVFAHLVVTAVCLLLMLGCYSFLYDVFQYVPILRGMRAPVRDSVWLGLSVGALAAAGVQRLVDGDRLRLRIPLKAFAGLLLAGALVMAALYLPLLRGDDRATRVDGIAQEFPWESNRDRQTRLLHQIGGDALAALAFAAASLALLRAAQKASPAAARRQAFALAILVLADVFWAGRHHAPTLQREYWSRPPPIVSLLSREAVRPRIYSIDNGVHNLPGYAVDRRSARGLPITRRAASSSAEHPGVWSSAVNHLPLSVPAAWGVDSATGHTPIHPRSIEGYLALGHDPTYRVLPAKWQLDVASITHLVAPPPGPAFPRLSLPHSQWEAVQWPEELAKPGQGESAQVFRNLGALPRARLVGRVVYAHTDRAADLRNARFDPAEVIVVDDPDRPLPEAKADAGDALPADRGTATIAQYEAERVVVDVAATKPCYLFLADTYYPEWDVMIDGRRGALRAAQPGPPQFLEQTGSGNERLNRSGLAFRAVFLTPGRHHVEFRYSRRTFHRGCLVSLFGCALCATLWFLGGRRWSTGIGTTGTLPAARRFRGVGAILLAAAIVISIATHWSYWKIRTDDDGRWIGSFHTYQWEVPLP